VLFSRRWITTKPTVLTELVIKSQDNVTLSTRIFRLSLNEHFNGWVIWWPCVCTVTARTSIGNVCLISSVTKLLVDKVVILIISFSDNNLVWISIHFEQSWGHFVLNCFKEGTITIRPIITTASVTTLNIYHKFVDALNT